MKILGAAAVAVAMSGAATAQTTEVEQKGAMDRTEALYQISQHFVEAAKMGNEASIREIALPNASFLDENWNHVRLGSSSIAKLAKNCGAVYGYDPEIMAGRISLPHDKQSIFWQCPQNISAIPVKTIIEYSGNKIAFVRNITGPSAVIVAAPR